MRKRWFWVSWLLVLTACGGGEGLPPSLLPGSASGANLVLLTLDTTRADRLGIYGWERARTPALDRLAQEGLRFTTAMSPAPMTLPAHASILTGLDPTSHGVRHNGQFSLDESYVTLAEQLKSHGYDTAAFVSAFVLDSRYGLDQGFDIYDDKVAPVAGQAFGGLDSQRGATDVTDRALEWLNRESRGHPFFLWVHYYDPHAPYEPPAPFEDQFTEAPYDGELAYMDSEIDRLIEVIRSRHTETLVVAVGDHGESLGEHREPTHSRFIYDATQRVPWILWAPSVFKGPRVIHEVVGLVDVFPTILDVLGIAQLQSSPLDGSSLVRSFEEPDRAIYMETLATYLDNGWAPLHGLRTRHRKYILAPRPEYYDLDADPGEASNRYESRTRTSDETLARLESLMREKLEGTETAASVAEQARAVDDDALRRLQALGYLGGSGPADPSNDSDALPDPKDMVPVLQLLAEAEEARRAERFDEALEKAERARRGAPQDLQVLQELGLIYAQTDRLEDAEQVFEEYLGRKQNVNVSILLANVLRRMGRSDEGRALVERARQQEPSHGGVLITLGDFLAEEGRPREALVLYERAREVDPYRASMTANQRILELRTR